MSNVLTPAQQEALLKQQQQQQVEEEKARRAQIRAEKREQAEQWAQNAQKWQAFCAKNGGKHGIPKLPKT